MTFASINGSDTSLHQIFPSCKVLLHSAIRCDHLTFQVARSCSCKMRSCTPRVKPTPLGTFRMVSVWSLFQLEPIFPAHASRSSCAQDTDHLSLWPELFYGASFSNTAWNFRNGVWLLSLAMVVSILAIRNSLTHVHNSDLELLVTQICHTGNWWSSSKFKSPCTYTARIIYNYVNEGAGQFLVWLSYSTFL